MPLPHASILNKIALTGLLKTNMCKILFQLSPEEQKSQNAMRAQAMVHAGRDALVIRAFMSLAPLLMEHEAVTYFLSQPSNAGFLGFVANPTTPEEAVGIANVTEGPLTEQQREDLMELFYERRGWARGEPPN